MGAVADLAKKRSMTTLEKNWNHYVVHAEEVARTPAFGKLRDRILELADPADGEIAVDIGAGTGLLSLPLAATVAKVWAIDISPAMCEYLTTKAASAGLDNVETTACSAVSLPLVDASADLVVSNYCFHHLGDSEKRRAVAEVFRVLRPGGRFVCGDMMFAVSVVNRRDRRLIWSKVRALIAKGPGGIVRLLRNLLRFAGGRGERPAREDWWRSTLAQAGFAEVQVELFAHEGGIAAGRRPAAASRST